MPTTRSATPISQRGVSCNSSQGLLDPRAAVADRGARAAGLLDDQRLDRPARLADHLGQAVAVETLAAQRDQQHRADVRMGADPPHDAIGVGVGIAAGKADQVDALLAEGQGNLAGHVMGTLDQVGDDDVVADAFAAVRTKKALHGDRCRVPFRTRILSPGPAWAGNRS